VLADMKRWQVSAVVVGPCREHDALVVFYTGLLGRPPRTTEGVDLWEGVAAQLTASGA
jgi:hypothetical protein